MTAPPHAAGTAAASSTRWYTLVVLSLGVSLIVIDGTIVNVSLPVIIQQLKLDLVLAEWVNTVYALVFASLLITAGRLGDRLGRRRLFVVGVVVFVAGSLLAGLSNSSGALIGARVIQGVGGALILPSTLSTVNATFRGRDRSIAFGVWGATIASMAAFGPLLGGWLTTDFDWHWIFLINFPVGILILVGIARYVPETRGQNFAPGLDVDGFQLSVIGLGGLVFGLVEGRTYGWLTPARNFTLLGVTWSTAAPISVPAAGIILGLVALVLFVAWERHRAQVGRSALLDLSLFTIRSFRWGNVAALVVALGEFGLLFTLPLYLQNVRGLSALGSGLVLASMAVGAFASGGSAGQLSKRMSGATIASTGLAIEALLLIVLALVIGPATPGWLVALILLVYGVGLGLSSAQLTGVILAGVPAELSGQGSATQSTMRQIGSALGAAVLGTILGASIDARAAGSLAGISGLPTALQHQLEAALSASAGGILGQIRDGVISVPVGAKEPVLTTLSTAFADATRTTMLAGGLFLALGFGATLLLPRSPEGSDPSSQTVGTEDVRAA